MERWHLPKTEVRQLHICSGVSGVIPGLGTALFEEGVAHADDFASPAGIQEVDGGQALFDLLTQLLEEGVRLDYMDFHTHGVGGAIQLGTGTLETWRRFRGRGFERLFRERARIAFHGCNVAEEPQGELFLTQAGSVWVCVMKVGGFEEVGFGALF